MTITEFKFAEIEFHLPLRAPTQNVVKIFLEAENIILGPAKLRILMFETTSGKSFINSTGPRLLP